MPAKKPKKKSAARKSSVRKTAVTVRSATVSPATVRAATVRSATVRAATIRQTVVDDFVIIPKSDQPISLTVTIGDIDQTGSTRLEIADDGLFPPKHVDGSFNHLPLENSNRLDGKTLLMITSVTDTNNNTDNNRTEVTVKLHAGADVLYVRKMQSDVKSEGDTETYIFNIQMHAF